MCAPIVVTTTHLGLPLPSIRLAHPSTHPLALCHRHPTPSSPWATSKSIFMHTCTCMPDLGQQPPVPLILDPPWSFLTHPTTFLSISIGISVHPQLRSHYNTLLLGAHTTCT